MSNGKVKVSWKKGAKEKLLTRGDVITKDVARQTLDRTYPTIPLAKTVNSGRLRLSSMSGGVKGSDGNYYIGSYTSYAKYVWVMGSGTNWSTPGTNGKWYAITWLKEGTSILKNSIERNWLK